MPKHQILTGKKRLKVLFVRAPRHYWPIINESDNFLLPLAYPTLIGWLRKKMGDAVECEILDCCPHHIGWQSLAEEYRRRKPDVVCVGEKTVYVYEGLRALQLAKEVNPEVVTIAGGQIFSALPGWSFEQLPELDYIIRYEGEQPLEQLLRALQTGGSLREVSNLCYMENETMVETPLDDPVENLDDLPMPAYDIADLDKYSPYGYLWPKAATIQRGRGCIDQCNFCSWIALEARHTRLANGQVIHKTFYRSKSVERVLEEVDILYHKFGVRYLFWVDATWNLDPEWLEKFCSEVIRRKYKLGWWAFTRIDQFLEQEKLGVAELMVKAGLRHVLVGVERAADPHYDWLNKHSYGYEVTYKAFHLMKKKYPQVFRQGTIITGIRPDTKESIQSLLAMAHDADFDFAAFHPIMPFPGTPLYEEARQKGWIEETDFSKYDMFYPVMGTDHLSREEVAYWTTWCQKNFVGKKPLRYFSRMLSPHSNRRRLHQWFAFSIGRVLGRDAWNALTRQDQFRGFAGVNSLWKPKWYEE